MKAGQAAHLSVTAFPNVTFSGVVHEVQLNPTIVSNVVTYDAVLLVHDPQATAQAGDDGASDDRCHDANTRAGGADLGAPYRPLTSGGPTPAAPSGGPVWGLAAGRRRDRVGAQWGRRWRALRGCG